MKKMLISLLLLALVSPTVLAVRPVAEGYDHEVSVAIKGYDTTFSGVTVYPNDTDKPRVIASDTYNFRYAKVFIFDKDGRLIEAGGDLLANKDGTYGAPQLSVTVPAGGFLAAFSSSSKELWNCYNVVMEGAMLYNATMSIIYPMYGSYDKGTNTLTIRYDDPVAPSKDAPRYLFVGNSTTYFNGTPIKFKAVTAAAGKEVVVEYCTFGSAYLSEFADPNHERGKAFREKLKNNKYDYIVFQDAASADYYMSKAAMDVLMPLVEANGAQGLLYMRYSTGDAGTERHYGNYPRLAEDFGLPCANVTGAFNICREEYPDINLMADDGGHHSCEGSYLIACTWMYAFMGVDPRGNAYTANLPAETVAALQECAVKAVEAGLELPEKDLSATHEGTKYENFSAGKTYTTDGDLYDGKWTDADENGKPLGKRTDGNFATAGDDTAMGCWSTSTGTTSIVVDLEEIRKLHLFRTDLWGGTWGIPNPADSTVSISVSVDGKAYTDLGEATPEDLEASGEWKGKLYTLFSAEGVEARYIKFTYTMNDGNRKFCWSSENAVYGLGDAIEPPTENPGEESTEESTEGSTETSTETSAEASTEAPAESTPAENSTATAEEGGSATLWIVLGAVAAAAVAVVGILLGRKKKA